MRKITICFLLSVLIFAGCKKEKKPEAAAEPPPVEEWQRVHPNYYLSLSVSGGTVFGVEDATRNSVVLSTDCGSSWSALNSTFPFNASVRSLTTKDSMVYIGLSRVDSVSPFGIYSCNKGNWLPKNNGLDGSLKGSYRVKAFENTLYAIFGIEFGTTNVVFYSKDKGESWQTLPNLFLCNSLAAGGTNIFVGQHFYYGGGIIKTSDNGKTWLKSSTGLPDSNSVDMIKIIGSKVFANVYSYNNNKGGLYVSGNNGSTWTICETLRNLSVADILVSGSKLFALAGSRAYVSSDNGNTWDLLNSNLVDIVAMAVCGSKLIVSNRANQFFNPGLVGIHVYEIK